MHMCMLGNEPVWLLIKVHKQENIFGAEFGFLFKLSFQMEKCRLCRQKIFFEFSKIQEERVALARTQCTPQRFQRTLSTRSSFGVC